MGVRAAETMTTESDITDPCFEEARIPAGGNAARAVAGLAVTSGTPAVSIKRTRRDSSLDSGCRR